jgi:glutaredoxin
MAMTQRTRRRTVPQIYIGDHHVGGLRRSRAH